MPDAPAASEEVKKLAAEIAGKVERGKWAQFPMAVISDPKNAPALVHLASTTTDKEIAYAALMAMTRFDSQDKAQVDDAFATAVLRRLEDPDPKVQYAALGAARRAVAMKPPSAKVAEVLKDLAWHARPVVRIAALDSYVAVPEFGKSVDATAPAVDALDAPELWLAANALGWLYQVVYGYPDKPTLRAKVMPMTKHAEPVIRSRAIGVIANMAKGDEAAMKEAATVAVAALDDPSSGVRCAAIGALADARDKSAIHKIVKFLDDPAKAEGTLEYTTLQDKAGGEGTPPQPLAQCAANALSWLSDLVGEKLDVKRGSLKAEELAEAVKKAKAWYEKTKSKIPE